MLAIAPELLGFMPKFVLGGLLLYLGADQLHKWLIEIAQAALAARIPLAGRHHRDHRSLGIRARHPDRRRHRLRDFAHSARRGSRSIKYSFDGAEYRSSLDRSRDDQEVLLAHGGKIQGLNPQSYLFFGSANRLYQHVKHLLQERPECRYLLFDFKLVTGVDLLGRL